MANEKKQPKRLLVMAGGTGGHIFPALAVAEQLRKQDWQIAWLGTADRMEAEIVPKQGIDIYFIDVKGLRGSGLLRKLFAPFMIFRAVLQARKYIKDYAPNAVLGMGGYVSGPAGIAAYLSGVPIVLHEQNAVAGMTNRWLAKIATRTLQAFPSAFSDAEVVGNPVRADLCALPVREIHQDDQPLKVLVMGGSQGADILNRTLPEVVARTQRPLMVCHQAGKDRQVSTLAAYQENLSDCTNVEVVEFIDDVAERYQWADVLICRSGALTVSEVAVASLPAIFVPFMHKDRQQALNAEFLVNNGAAMMIEQPELTAEKLSSVLDALDFEKRTTMSQAARKLAVTNAAERVSDVIQSVAK